MAEERDPDTPSLEPPSLFGRKKRKPAPPPPPAEPPPLPDAAVQPEPVAPEAVAPEPVAPEPVAPEPVAPEPVAPVPVQPVVPERVAPEPTQPLAPDDSPTTILDDTTVPTPDPGPEALPVAAEPDPPRPPREPWLTGTAAAVVTGLLVGAVIVAATAGSLRICTAVRGTSSCGGSGFFLLLAIMVVAVLLGAALLRAARVPEPGSTSFLAVGLLSVVALLFLVGSIFEWWMAIVIPVVSVATFLLSHWVTVQFVDPADDGTDASLRAEEHDVR